MIPFDQNQIYIWQAHIFKISCVLYRHDRAQSETAEQVVFE